MLLDTAEEWTVYNYSISLWVDTAKPAAGQYGLHYPGQPLLRADAQARFAAQPEHGKTWNMSTAAVDHPFHMHINPVWVTRIEVPDEQGNLVNVLDKPEWRDVVWVPRNGGRVVFRLLKGLYMLDTKVKFDRGVVLVEKAWVDGQPAKAATRASKK